MDKQFLDDYFQNEIELCQDYIKKTYNKSPHEPYPPFTRFPKLQKPYTYAVIGKEAPLWSQMLCTGSLIVPLVPQKDKNQFKETYGFSKNDVDDIIQFSKETGRIQFILESHPTEFENLPFLEPIFQELHPPLLIDPRGQMSKTRYDAFIEIQTIIDLDTPAYFQIMRNFQTSASLNQDLFNFRVLTMAYADLRELGFDEIADEIFNNMLLEPYKAIALLDVCEAFITGPIFDPFHAQMSVNYERAVSAKNLLGTHFDITKSNIFPCEIGAFLFKKKSINPKNFESSKLALDIYTENQFYKVYQAFNDAISAKNYSLLDSQIRNIDEIFTQIWDDAEGVGRTKELIKKPIDFVNVGIGLSIAELASRGIASSDMGFLYGLGYLAATSLAGDILKNDIPEYISRLIEKPYNVTIYDYLRF